jgi:O-antigen/teichoic acid export membrane protein
LSSQDKPTPVKKTPPEGTAPRTKLWTALTERVHDHRTLIHFSTASVAFNLTTMLANIIILRWIGPADMGLWQLLLLIQSYSLVVQCGVFNGLNRELPFRMGTGDDNAVKEFAGTTQSVAIGGGIILLIGGLGSLLFIDDTTKRYTTAIVFLCSAENLYVNYLAVTYRADKAFRTLTWLRVFQAAVTLLTLPLVCYFGFAGLIGRYLLITTAAMSLNHAWRPIHVRPSFIWQRALTLLKVGVPVYILGYIVTVADTFPQVLLSGSGTKMVGLFSPVSATITMMQMLPVSIAQYIYPHMSYRFGKTGDPATLWPIAWKTSVGLLVLLLPVLPIGIALIPWVLRAYFPQYADAAGAVKFGLMSGMFLGASISMTALFSLKAWFWAGVYSVGRAVSTYVLLLLMIWCWTSRLEAVAAGYMLAQAFAFALAMFCIYRATHPKKPISIPPSAEMEKEPEISGPYNAS